MARVKVKKEIEIPYTRWKGAYLPMVPVHVIGFGAVNALIDSGAKTSIFQIEVAQRLHIDVGKGKRVTVHGVHGKIVTYEHRVPVEIMGIRFNCKMAFAKDYHIDLNILGRNNFFRKFIVTFDEKKRLTTLQAK